MRKVHKLKFSLIILVSVLLTNCKSEKKIENYISELNLSENISNFTSQMTEKDTVRITANLTMEYWVRIDELILTKKNNKLILQTTIKEDTTYERKYQIRKHTLAELNIENLNNEFEQHFLGKINRTTRNSNENWIYRIINQKDTLKFHTVGLGDKGGCVREYFEFMTNYYPNEKEEFKLIEVSEETE
jgi:hypothetical protein